MKKPVLSLQEVLELYLAEHEYENSSKATIQYYIWNIGRFIRFLIDAYFGHIRTLIPGTSGRCFGIIRTAFRLIRTPCRVN